MRDIHGTASKRASSSTVRIELGRGRCRQGSTSASLLGVLRACWRRCFFVLAWVISAAAPAMATNTCRHDRECARDELCVFSPCTPAACSADDSTCTAPACESVGRCSASPNSGTSGRQCDDDTECDVGEACRADLGAGSDCACSAHDASCSCALAPPVTRRCVALGCASDADCAIDSYCFLSADDGGCAPGLDCARTDRFEEPTRGRCRRDEEHACSSDAECAPGYGCGEQVYADGARAELATGNPSARFCRIIDRDCRIDSDCLQGWSCSHDLAPLVDETSIDSENCVDSPACIASDVETTVGHCLPGS